LRCTVAVMWTRPPAAPRGGGVGGGRAGAPRPPARSDLIAGFRHGLFDPQTVRLIVDLRHPVLVVETLQLPPLQGGHHRLVVDIARRPDSGPQVATAGLPEPPVPRLQPTAPDIGPPKLRPDPAQRAAVERRVVVIDPGHGGRDGGAIGVSGTVEKEIVLAVALKLRDRLLATGRYDVVLTREEDTYVGLRDRLTVARGARADAFISLHADSLANPALRGASVYTLSDTASDREAEELARMHNKADILNGLDLSEHDPEVQRILIDLAQRDTNNRSIDLAGLIVAELGKVTAMLRRDQRHAGFVVLKSPDVPSVLVELGFLSNPTDEANLRDRDHRAGLADALSSALDRYFFGDRSS
jgi:N-acetylmuramoyl-L-alanine amidase